MKSGTSFIRRFVPLAVAGILVVVLAACTGRGGGYLPPDGVVFKGQAAFGFTFSCENGELKIELAYTDKGRNPIGSSFGIHGTVDVVDPVLESTVCIGQNAPPESEFGNQLIFLGRYRLTSGAPASLASTCQTRETPTAPLCRFEVTVRDNDQNFAPSPGDYFGIKLSTVTTTPCNTYPPDPTCSQLPPASVPYARAGWLAGGNVIVD
jgi:hypothetical protein